jgi:short-subunit dehydrogenase|tara:strand:- start:1092 stop:1793 length:702 start_codon:yes stop_codon:yes gene_type:complete
MIIIFGSSKGVGKALANVFEDKKTLLISRQKSTLKKNQIHLSLDINNFDYKTFDNQIINEEIEAIFFPVGLLKQNDDLNLNSEEINEIMNTNFLSIAKITGHIIQSKSLSNSCSICFFSSVTTILPRDKNIIYCAAKNSLNSYYKSLDTYIKLNKLNIRLSLIILGFVNTTMNQNIKTFFPKMEAGKIAFYLKKNIKKLKGVYYIPYYWLLIKILISLTPNIMKLLISKMVNR